MAVQIMQFIAIIVGASLLGTEFGVNVGVGIGSIAYALMPAQH